MLKRDILCAAIISTLIVFAQTPPDPQANLLRKWKLFGTAGTTAIGSDGVIACSVRSLSDIAGVSQNVDIGQTEAAKLTLSVESKAQDISGGKDNNFGVYADITHADGSKTWGVSVPCQAGTHDWEQSVLVFTPEKPVKSVNFYLLLRKKTGSAWFRNAMLTDESKPFGRSGSRPSPVGGPRIQTAVPDGFKEIPYHDENSVPEPTAEETARGFLLFTRSINQPIYAATKPLPSERTSGISTFATRGEYEPVTFGVYSLRDITNMQVSVSELKSKDAVIGADALDLRLVTEWNIRYPNYTSKNYQRMPELIESVSVCSFGKGESRRYWLRIHVPDAAAPGLYRGTIMIGDERSGQVSVPLSLRVLGFSLLRDPKKRYSVYYYGGEMDHIPDDLLGKAESNELAAMRAYGIDMFPTIALLAEKDADGSLRMELKYPDMVERMVRMGFVGPIPINGGIWEFYKKYVPGGKIGGHWAVDVMPANDDIYKDIERAFKDLRQRSAAKGWPEFICCPLDEVAPASAEFSARVYAAIRAAGVKTYITKDPTALDAGVYQKYDAVDAWCSQPFAVPYEKAAADIRYDYWSYPNHNAGEIKDRVVMQKGGRMTYGYGLWKSGYTTLIPWRWRWVTWRDDHFDYLRAPKESGCGNRLDERGNVIPAVYWECFREGYDDARYVYTLSQAVYEREGSSDARCRSAAERGKALLQKIWDSIVPQQKYLAADMWADDQFVAARWRMALAIDELLRFPAVRSGTAPSVIVDALRPAAAKADVLGDAAGKGLVVSYDLGGTEYALWKAMNSEVTASVVPSDDGKHALRMNVAVDHTVDGGGENGKYPIGWPRLRREFSAGEVTLSDYDYLTFMVRIDSDRDEVSDDTTPMIVTIQTHEGGHDGFKGDVFIDLGDRQRVRFPVRISIRDLIARSGRDASYWRTLKAVQFVIAEANYRDKTRLTFDIDTIELVKLKQPVIETVECTDTILLPARYLDVTVSGLGMASTAYESGYQMLFNFTAQGKKVLSTASLFTPGMRFPLNVSMLTAGVYTLECAVADARGVPLSRAVKSIEVMDGFAPAK